MALRIRKDGRLLCAAMHPSKPGDTYIPDDVSEILSGAAGGSPVIGTESWEKHRKHGEWWWLGNVPDDVEIEVITAKRGDRSPMRGSW